MATDTIFFLFTYYGLDILALNPELEIVFITHSINVTKIAREYKSYVFVDIINNLLNKYNKYIYFHYYLSVKSKCMHSGHPL